MDLATDLRNWMLGALGALMVSVALVAGCGGIDPAPLPLPPRSSVEELLGERTFSVGEVDVVEQVFVTNADRSQVFHLRARITNRGPDIEAARYELLVAREVEVFSRFKKIPPDFEVRPPEVGAFKELGRLHSSQTALVALEAREFGAIRVQVMGRFVTVTP